MAADINESAATRDGTSAADRISLVLASVLGLITLGAWVFALWLVLASPRPYNPDRVSSGPDCGSPAFFSERTYADSITYRPGRDEDKTYDADTALSIADDCVDPVRHRINAAVGVSVASAPVAALWLWLAMVVRTDRLVREGGLAPQPASSTAGPDPDPESAGESTDPDDH